MATYAEIFDIFSNSALENKVIVACIVAAEAIRSEAPATSNHANRLLWARQALTDPAAIGRQMFMAVLAANAGLTTAQIKNATDSAIQSSVNAAVDLVATGA